MYCCTHFLRISYNEPELNTIHIFFLLSFHREQIRQAQFTVSLYIVRERYSIMAISSYCIKVERGGFWFGAKREKKKESVLSRFIVVHENVFSYIAQSQEDDARQKKWSEICVYHDLEDTQSIIITHIAFHYIHQRRKTDGAVVALPLRIGHMYEWAIYNASIISLLMCTNIINIVMVRFLCT